MSFSLYDIEYHGNCPLAACIVPGIAKRKIVYNHIIMDNMRSPFEFIAWYKAKNGPINPSEIMSCAEVFSEPAASDIMNTIAADNIAKNRKAGPRLRIYTTKPFIRWLAEEKTFHGRAWRQAGGWALSGKRLISLRNASSVAWVNSVQLSPHSFFQIAPIIIISPASHVRIASATPPIGNIFPNKIGKYRVIAANIMHQ
jgi:hypothetical protein